MDILQTARDDLKKVEDSLGPIIRWWQDVEAEVDYLLKNSQSSLSLQRNTVILAEIKDSFTKLESYFADYRDKVRTLTQ